MDKPDRTDQQMRQLFSAARRVDRENLPNYRAVRDAERRRSRKPARPLWLSGLVATTASAALVLGIWALAPQRERAPYDLLLPVTPPAELTARALPPPPPAPGPAPVSAAADETAVEKKKTAPSPAPVEAPKTRPAPPPPPPSPVASALAQLARIEALSNDDSGQTRFPQAVDTILEEVAIATAQDVVKFEMTDDDAKLNDEVVQSVSAAGRSFQRALSLAPGVQGQARITPSQSKALVAADPPQGAAGSRTFEVTVRLPLDDEAGSRESYDLIQESGFVATLDEALSTFSIDVDTASYANVRRFLNSDRLPPRDAVRIEELINYFDYDYPEPSPGDPFSTSVEVGGCPWNAAHRLARIGIKAREADRGDSRGTNLVFLIDVSGSMRDANKLPLLKSAFALLVDQLGARDQVAIVVYAGSSGLALPSTSGADRKTILDAIARLEAGGSTNGRAGLDLAYQTARENFIAGGVNRVVLATDGDFNVGQTHAGDLLRAIRHNATRGISLTTLGFGMGNLDDATLEHLADKGDGNYFYIDTEREARKVLVDELQGTLVTIAKDVKIQVEFNPSEVAAYRLIGYENRALARQDFNDDRKDAGEIGSGHAVTALYEIVPAGLAEAPATVDPLRYQSAQGLSREADSGELLTVKVRYKMPGGFRSRLLEFTASDDGATFRQASDDFRFAAAVASFGMVLRESEHRGNADLDGVAELLAQGVGADKGGYRAEFVTLVQQARSARRP